MTSTPPRRIVTGHDEKGRSVLLSDGPTPTSRDLPTGVRFHEIWATADTPVPIDPAERSEPTDGPLRVPPGDRGTIVHVIDMPAGSGAPMHRTRTVDYGIVLDGEVYLEMDDGSETRLTTGDVVVQRGTAHGWSNRSEVAARMVFVMVDGAFTDELRSTVGDEALSQLFDQTID
jgi:quercetin dioxygenase-like cupin family protein